MSGIPKEVLDASRELIELHAKGFTDAKIAAELDLPPVLTADLRRFLGLPANCAHGKARATAKHSWTHAQRVAESPPHRPTRARPGSRQKEEILMERYAQGLPLWHPGDYDPREEDRPGSQPIEIEIPVWEGEDDA